MTLGPLMLGIDSLSLTSQERELLRHPAVGGVILFPRNYAQPDQLRALTDEIHALRQPPLLIAVDQEGGRVQRFVNGFTPLPAMRLLGHQYDLAPATALDTAQRIGWLMAAELVAGGVDLSFAPVLDLDWGISEVIGDRAFHRTPDAVATLARAFVAGMQGAGMVATGKHFPGHGAVIADSHLALPEDHRSYSEILEDLTPYEWLIPAGLGGVMVAHVVYTELDPKPAGFSRWWLQTELRQRLGFRGAIFSDDLCMVAAEVAGDPAARARAALDAGCDMVLVCNDRDAAVAVAQSLSGYSEPVGQLRLARLHGGGGGASRATLRAGDTWRDARAALGRLGDRPDLVLDG